MERAVQKLIVGLLSVLLPLPSIAGGAIEDIAVTDVQILAMSEGQINTAAYMKLVNDCRCEEHALIAAYSPVAREIELHSYEEANGRMKMRQIDEIILQSNSELIFKPGGPHLMLMGVKKQIKDGDSVPLTLEFEDGSRLELTAHVKKMWRMN